MSTKNEPGLDDTTVIESKEGVKLSQNEHGRNDQMMRCKFCSCLVLRQDIASLVDLEKMLPKMDGQHEPEAIGRFWCVDDIFQFENMSFSKTVENMKYLSCCDCDIGPIGYQDLDNKSCYVATQRVTYSDQ